MSGRKIIDGLREAVAHAKGDTSIARVHKVRVPDQVDVRAIRERLQLSQAEFAFRFGFSLGCVKNWEQGRRFPDGSARVFLRVIEREPEAVEKALAVG
jgi:putative transcriptional regulator